MSGGIEHVGLSVSSLERSISFYCDILGFKLERIIESGADMGLGDIVGMDGAEARIAHLSSEKAMLELFEYKKPRGRTIRKDSKQADIGFIHIGIETKNLKEDYKNLKEKGVKFFGDPVKFRPGVWVVYFYGPDREVCELRQS